MNFAFQKYIAGVVAGSALFMFSAGPATAGLDTPHNAGNSLGCLSCHDLTSNLPKLMPPWTSHPPANIDDTSFNSMCWSCHDGVSAPFALTHSSLNTSSRYGDWTVECWVCHNLHSQDQLRKYGAAGYLYSGASTGLTATTLTRSGAGWTVDEYVGMALVPNIADVNYSYTITANTEDTLTVRGTIDLSKAAAGNTFAITLGKLIRSSINLARITDPLQPADKTGYKTVRFFRREGTNSFADGNATYDGICEICHTETSHFQNDGGGDDQTHTNVGAVAGSNCTDCHSHENGFAHGGGSGTGCVACHGHDTGTLFDPDMQAPYTAGAAVSSGRGTVQSHSTHTETDTDDQKGPGIYCDTCHDITRFPYFKSGTDSNGDGRYDLAETDVCDACHSGGGGYDGLNDPVTGAKTIWKSGAYASTSDSTLQAGKEKWCATCHDEAPSVIGGVTAPNVIGDENGAYTYGTGWGYYKTGHGLPSADVYPASGDRTYGAGKKCEDCHDLSTAHIDGDARSYSAAGNNYRTGYRLKTIDGRDPMHLPLPQNNVPHDPDKYALCLSCHDANRYLLRNTAADPKPVTTSFRDDLDLGPWDGGDPPINIHEYHLSFNSLFFDSDWSGGGGDSLISCVNCHNVHGSTQLSMIRDGRLVGRQPGFQVYYDNAMTAPTVASGSPPSPADITLNNSTGTVFAATSAGNICGNCHGGGWVKWYRTPPAAQSAPTLAWTGEANYATDGVDPDSGQGGDFFTFRIRYTDANAQPPRAIQVWVDENDNGSYEADEQHDLHEVDSDDIDVTDGKVYRTILSLDNAGDGTLTYRFHATDGKFDATGAPTDPTANTLSIGNNAPFLSWTGEEGYTADGVNPNAAATGSTFTFRVSYTDSDNNAPTAIQLWVDKNDDGDYLDAGEQLDMTETDPTDTTYADGKIYSVAATLAAAGDNSINYRFSASDGQAATGIPILDRSLTITTTNTAPTLEWTGETNYSRDGVNPDTGTDGDTFTFRVNYADIDNQIPAIIQVWIDRNDDDDYLDPSEKLDLTPVDAADADFSDGRLYTLTTTIAAAGDGSLNYRFFATDGTEEATGEPAADHIVSLLTDAIRVSCQGTGVYDYTSLQDAINNAVDGDTILVADGTCTERITIDNKDLTIKSINGAMSTIIDGSAGGVVVTMLNGADSTLDGLTFRNGDGGNGYGGGFAVSNSSPVITNSIITGNRSDRAGGIYMASSGSQITISHSTLSANSSSFDGGALYMASGASAFITDTLFDDNSVSGGSGGAVYVRNADNATLSIHNSTFTRNSAVYGGAIYAFGYGTALLTSVDIANCLFTASDTTDAGTIAATRNSSSNRGGAIYMVAWDDSIFSLNISDTTIEYANAVFEGGGMYLRNLDTTTITRSTFAGNSAPDAGFLHYDGTSSNRSITITDSTIRDNFATGSNKGAFYLIGGTISFDRCSITGNSTPNRGGAGYIAGSLSTPAVSTIQNCIVTGNRADNYEGGALWLTDDGNSTHTINILNSTFSGNYAGDYGGAINRNNTVVLTITNSIFWRNSTGLRNYEINGADVLTTASYSDIRQSGFSGSNNLNTDPLFVNAVAASEAPTSAGDYHLQTGSPLVNAGTSTGAPAVDIDRNIRPLGAAVDIGADEVGTVVNTAPALSWTGEVNFSADGVDPDQAAPGSAFVFRVNYADRDNIAPTAIQVWIDLNDDGDYLDGSEKIDLTAVDAGDVDYTDGKLYTATQTLNWAGDGVLRYRFVASDGYETASGAPTFDMTVLLNSAPLLSWIGSGNYSTDGVNPDSGATGASFEFRVKYADADNNGPSAIQVWVDKNDDGDYLDAGEMLTMLQLDPGDTVLTDGKDYYRTISLAGAGDNQLNYRFYASDGQAASGAPTTDSVVTIINNAPTLAWTGNTNFTADGVHPNNAVGGATYAFQVNYTDGDNQPPSAIQVWVDKNDDGDYLDGGETLDLNEVDTGDTNYTDGKLYALSLILNYAGSGDGYLNYRFFASDGSDNATGDPTSDSQVGVFAANHAPDLNWTGEPNYTTDGIDPDTGAVGDTFTFRVTYTDVENTVPSSIQVWVDLNDDGDFLGEEGTELLAMNEADAGDTTCDDGKLYTLDVVVNAAGDGTLLYSFSASDGTDNATGNATVNKTFTVALPIQVCGVNDIASCNFTSIQSAINAALSTPPCNTRSFIKVCDGTYSENINYSGKNLTISSVNGAASTTIQGSGANSAVVTFSSGETGSAVLNGFTINNTGSNTATRGINISGAAPTIKNCVIEGNDAPNATNGGGGIYIDNASPTFDSCVIRANSTLNRIGGGFHIRGAAGGATITNCIIGGDNAADRNYSNNGSAGAIYYLGPTTGSLTISNSSIKNNVAATDGPGLYLSGLTNLTTITNSTISYNSTSGGYGGGIYANGSPVRVVGSHIDNNVVPTIRSGGGIYMIGAASSLQVEAGSTISSNSQPSGGGAVYISGSTAAVPLSISDTTISGNTAAQGGGAIQMSTLTNTSSFTNVTITNNTANNNYGGGIYASGAPFTMTGSIVSGNNAPSIRSGGGICVESTTADISSTSVTNNTAGAGGGIAVIGIAPSLTLTKVKVLGNNANATAGGGGIQVGAGTATITNSLIAGNITANGITNGGGGIINGGTLNLHFSTVADNYAGRQGGGLRANGAETVRNSIIWGNVNGGAGGTETDGVVDTLYLTETSVDPKYVLRDTANSSTPKTGGIYRLQSDSNCIDTGDATTAPADDLDGTVRPVDISGKGDGLDDYDKGAYEYAP